MNYLLNNPALCKIKKLCAELGDIQLKSDYHAKLSLYRNGESEHPSSSHSINGSSKCRIVKIVAVIISALLLLSVLSNILRCLNYKK